MTKKPWEKSSSLAQCRTSDESVPAYNARMATTTAAPAATLRRSMANAYARRASA
jgi:hypothetical protein